MGSQNAVTSSKDASGHVSSTTIRRGRKPGKRPPGRTLSGKNKPLQSCRRDKRKRGRPRGRPPKKFLFLSNKLYHQHLILRSLTLALT